MRSTGWRTAHVSWGAFALGLSILVIRFGEEGHPPGIVFLPVVIAVWIAGHVGLWLAARLAASGRRAVAPPAASWPFVLWLAALGAGLGGATGLLQLGGTVLLRTLFPYRAPALWLTMACVWLAHGVCFVGLLLRRSWSRVLASGLATAWALLGVRQLTEQLERNDRIDVVELALLVAAILAMLALALRVARSDRVRAFLVAESKTKHSP